MSLKQYHVQAMILCEGNPAATQRHVEAIARIIRSEMLAITVIYTLCVVFLGAGMLAAPESSGGRLTLGLLLVVSMLTYVWAMVQAEWSRGLLRKDPQAWLTDAKYYLATGEDR